ncbi:hypothetical protein [Williamsia serinedens]|uniref:Tail assembly chaperone n=1 Tax=Williamsia serinedens TaxID=391736 RepID=A0ABT1H788_9NOCA|nr:hypothetical protein [Williamsia serinedens]MCP2163101.1 hypothetical protein [Williamsia serinedens]
MSVPEGYSVAPVSTDHLCKLAVPVPGRDEPVLIEAPFLAWMPPEKIDEYEEWASAMVTDEKDVTDWHTDNDHLPKDERTPFPAKKAKLVGDGDPKRKRELLREMKIRWIKPYMDDEDYTALISSTKLPEATITWIFDQLNKKDVAPVTVGESVASADS